MILVLSWHVLEHDWESQVTTLLSVDTTISGSSEWSSSRHRLQCPLHAAITQSIPAASCLSFKSNIFITNCVKYFWQQEWEECSSWWMFCLWIAWCVSNEIVHFVCSFLFSICRLLPSKLTPSNPLSLNLVLTHSYNSQQGDANDSYSTGQCCPLNTLTRVGENSNKSFPSFCPGFT